ncbi:MAG: hypothetical protein CR974_00275 [Gammaproteobacteria bacterium]|nr:MAG: hypothetical protein CR974_00275 [Gammaproteobacteria bacterium]
MKIIKGIQYKSAIDSSLPCHDFFLTPIAKLLFEKLDEKNQNLMQLDADSFEKDIVSIWNSLTETQQLAVRKLPTPTLQKNSFTTNPLQKILISFCTLLPEYALQLRNINFNANVSIKAAEKLFGESVNANNFVEIKKVVDDLNKSSWTRQQNQAEQQSGVSNLGSISEKLLEMAFQDKIDGINFFKTSNQEIQSYGDFVLMCLPNNLWISVKSNYARERLLASGYTTDIIGVGFFTDMKEFISRSKLRNFQRVGFLALYLPDIPITEKQVQDDISTYQQVADYYHDTGQQLPLNINGNPFLRPLSSLNKDLDALLEEKNIQKRTTISY